MTDRDDVATTAYPWTTATSTETLPLTGDGPVWDPRTGEWIEPTASREPAAKRPGEPLRTALIGALAGAVVAAAVAFPVARMTAHSTPAIERRIEAAPPAVSAAKGTGATSVVAIAQRARPWVVNIDVTGAQTTVFGSVPVAGTGSGVIIRSDGYIVTNAHVVEDARDIQVTLADGDKIAARVIGSDPDTDVAVVKVNRTGLPAAVLGSVENLTVGELAVAIGSPLGLSQTVTAGIVSALGRSVDRTNQPPLVDMVQTDAPITQGNSGGALIDATGAVVGINAAIAASPEVGAEGIAFAIPIDIAHAVASELIAHGRATHPWLGVSGRSIEDSQQFGVSEGAFIIDVTPGGPAAKAGMQKNDVVVEFDGKKIKSMDELVVAIREHKVGDKVTLKLVRNRRNTTVTAVVGDKPANLG